MEVSVSVAQKGIPLLLWSEQEDMLLKDLYLETPKEIILTKLNRTWKYIRYRANRLKFKRSAAIIKQDNMAGNKKVMLEKYGVEYSTLLPSMKEKSIQTNLKRRGVAYPTQSKEVRDKVKQTVHEKYGVDNVFQAQEIKEKTEQTLIKRYGVKNPNQSPVIREKTKKTNLERYGVSNSFQLLDRVKDGMIKKYGERIPLRVPELLKKVQANSISRYGTQFPNQNKEVRNERNINL